MNNRIPARHPLRNAVAKLSSGQYYDEISHWFFAVRSIIRSHNFACDSDCPKVYNNEGYSHLQFFNPKTGEEYRICWTWYRMSSFKWEIICYVTWKTSCLYRLWGSMWPPCGRCTGHASGLCNGGCLPPEGTGQSGRPPRMGGVLQEIRWNTKKAKGILRCRSPDSWRTFNTAQSVQKGYPPPVGGLCWPMLAELWVSMSESPV